MTLQNYKDQVSVEMGYKSFEHLYREFRAIRAPYSKIVTVLDEAAELYAKEAADKAWDAGSDRSIIKGSSAYFIRKETFMKELFKDHG